MINVAKMSLEHTAQSPFADCQNLLTYKEFSELSNTKWNDIHTKQ